VHCHFSFPEAPQKTASQQAYNTLDYHILKQIIESNLMRLVYYLRDWAAEFFHIVEGHGVEVGVNPLHTTDLIFLLLKNTTDKLLYFCEDIFNTNPHCFIAITKATACGWEDPLLPHPLVSPVGGRGKGSSGSAVLKFSLIKTWVTLKLASNAHWKYRFWWKLLKPKSQLRYFARHFSFLKQSLFQACRTYFRFSKWGSLNSIAVRIRVKM
jgi:hypothetical protein